jgi:hypothetical protein
VVGWRLVPAAILGLPRTTLLARMRKLGIGRDGLQSLEGQRLRTSAATVENRLYDRSLSHPQAGDNDAFGFAGARAANF